jgi:hypothetical protein
MEGEVMSLQVIFVVERSCFRTVGYVSGGFRSTGIRAYSRDHFFQSGFDVPRMMFDHVQMVG